LCRSSRRTPPNLKRCSKLYWSVKVGTGIFKKRVVILTISNSISDISKSGIAVALDGLV
ncbi:unnamed protein product, partial [Callosobruchus maculatus]